VDPSLGVELEHVERSALAAVDPGAKGLEDRAGVRLARIDLESEEYSGGLPEEREGRPAVGAAPAVAAAREPARAAGAGLLHFSAFAFFFVTRSAFTAAATRR
jgi:hypothetical protein